MEQDPRGITRKTFYLDCEFHTCKKGKLWKKYCKLCQYGVLYDSDMLNYHSCLGPNSKGLIVLKIIIGKNVYLYIYIRFYMLKTKNIV